MPQSITVDRAGEARATYTPSPGLQKKDQPDIHTMPKKFLHVSSQSAAQTKGVGLIILAAGALFLIAGLVFLYFYFSGTGDSAKLSAPENTAAPITADEGTLNMDAPKTPQPPVPAPPKAASPSVVPAKPIPVINEATSSEPEETEEPTTATSTSSAAAENAGPVIYKMALDTDNDGLTDAEELLLNTDLSKPDSDNDGYTDASELASLYNPAGSGRIIVNPSIKKYSNPTYKYALYYPSIWTVSQVGGHDSIMFDLGNGQKIQVVALTAVTETNLEDWYKDTFEVSGIKPGQMFYKMGWSALLSEDGLTVYLRHPASDIIFSVTYNLALDDVLHFKSVFMMMVNSMELE